MRDPIAKATRLGDRTNGSQLYARGVAAGKSGTEALALVNAKRREYENLSPGERAYWEEEAAQVRERARGRLSPLDNALSSAEQPEEMGGP